MTDTARKAEFTLRPQTAGTLVVQLDGDWRFENHPPACEQLVNTLEAQTTRPSRLRLQGDGLGDWDSALIIFLLGLQQHGKNTGLEIDYNPLPQGLQRLVALATAVPKRRQPRRRLLGIPILTKVGNLTIELHQTWRDSLGFIGEASISFANLLRGRIRFRRTDLTTLLEQCGAQALPIVTLISAVSKHTSRYESIWQALFRRFSHLPFSCFQARYKMYLEIQARAMKDLCAPSSRSSTVGCSGSTTY
jgi:phospholipid/cholesterol/gamma-HCH transport system permease protein